MNLAVQGRQLRLPVLPVVEEAERKLADDKEYYEEPKDLMIGVEGARLGGPS